MAQAERTWEEMRALECAACHTERERRNRLLASNDRRVLKEPFLSAPYVHKSNEPKYHAMLLRAVEDAKRSATGPHHILWVIAQDVPQNPKEVARTPAQLQKQRERFLQFHDQRTAGIPGMLPLFVGMRARVTEKIARGKDSQGEPVILLKHAPCSIHAWDLPAGDRKSMSGSQRMLDYLPRVIYVKFQGAVGAFIQSCLLAFSRCVLRNERGR